MSAAPDVSVVMGVYNGVEYLAESIQSILQQRAVHFEFIIVDDGSAPEVAAMLERIANADHRIRIIRQIRAGLTKALIKGCACARGRYIARQDNGDWSLPGRLAEQQCALDRDDSLAFVSCWTEACGPEGEFLSVHKGTGAASKPTDVVSDTTANGMVDGPSWHPSVMMRRDLYERAGGYRPHFYFGQDWDLWYRLAEVGKFQIIEHVLYRARVMPNSLSGRYKSEQEQIALLSYEAAVRRRRGESEEPLLKRAQAIRPSQQLSAGYQSALLKAKGLYFIGEQLRRNNDVRALHYFKHALLAHPAYIKPWLRLIQTWAGRRKTRALEC